MALSEVSLLYAKRVGDLERARDIFTDDCRAFVDGVLKPIVRGVKNWSQGRVRIDPERDVDESKAGYVLSQHACGNAELRFRRAANMTPVADLEFGLRYEKDEDCFVWQVILSRGAKFRQLDHLIWHRYKDVTPLPPGAKHFERENNVRFVMRHLDQLTQNEAHADVKATFDFLLGCESAIEAAVRAAYPERSGSDAGAGAPTSVDELTPAK